MRILLITAALMLTGCGNAPARQPASVTVKLPPARPYVPGPAFSFGAAPSQSH